LSGASFPGPTAQSLAKRIMNDSLQIKPCLLEGEDDLPENTPLYKYLPIEAFLYLYEFERINFTRITDWPDAYEGSRFEFFSNAKKDQRYSNRNTDEFYGSWWTLQSVSAPA